PATKVSVLSNATFILRKTVHEALMTVDNNILKLDTVDPDYIYKVDKPTGIAYQLSRLIEGMKAFNGHLIIQTMFMKGTLGGEDVNNTTDKYVTAWLKTVKEIGPQQVMVYTIDRDTPVNTLVKASPDELNSIRDRVIAAGILCTASY
ncbi:MAG: radical SAM protein, partial [Hoylesella saccharolytica]